MNGKMAMNFQKLLISKKDTNMIAILKVAWNPKSLRLYGDWI